MPRNRGKRAFRFVPAGLALALAACSSLPARQGQLADCQAAFIESDARARTAGAVDAGAHRVPGFPYLRVNRFLASFRNGLNTAGEFGAWASRLRARDRHDRRIELGLYLQPAVAERRARRLDECGRQLLAADLADPARRRLLRERARMPDAYSSTARALGLYPLAVPFLKLGIAEYRSAVRQRFADRTTDADERVYQPRRKAVPSRAKVGEWLATARAADPLDRPALKQSRLNAIARRHAPVWRVGTRGGADYPGVPRRGPDGLRIDASQPTTYWHAGYTRFDGRVLLQLNYGIWFTRRPASHLLDPLAGTLDGVVWRVTLDTDGRPLLYDSIHSCGCYHHFFPTDALHYLGDPGFWQEAPVVLDTAPSQGPVAVHLRSGSHYLHALSSVDGSGTAYRLRPYDILRRRKPRLFNGSGRIPGTERLERLFLWPSGVPSPGAMRQAGHHATAFVGRRHFDDPFLIGRYFRRVR